VRTRVPKNASTNNTSPGSSTDGKLTHSLQTDDAGHTRRCHHRLHKRVTPPYRRDITAGYSARLPRLDVHASVVRGQTVRAQRRSIWRRLASAGRPFPRTRAYRPAARGICRPCSACGRIRKTRRHQRRLHRGSAQRFPGLIAVLHKAPNLGSKPRRLRQAHRLRLLSPSEHDVSTFDLRTSTSTGTTTAVTPVRPHYTHPAHSDVAYQQQRRPARARAPSPYSADPTDGTRNTRPRRA